MTNFCDACLTLIKRLYNIRTSVILPFILLPFTGVAQMVDLNQSVTFQFNNERLETILSRISHQYQIPFAYSRNFIPINQRINVEVIDVPLGEGLDELFAATHVIYALIGNSIVLRLDRSKSIPVSIKKTKLPEIPIEKIEPPPPIYRDYSRLAFLTITGTPTVYYYHVIDAYVLDSLQRLAIYYEYQIPNIYDDSPYREMAQVTLIPGVDTHFERADSITNTFSFNVLYGINGGLEGLEVAGFGNTLRNHLKGVQVAGIWNRVDGNVSGVQFASVFNSNRGYTKGVQFTFGANITNEAKAIQIAGLMNIAKGDFSGLQLALFGNYIRTQGGDGVQVAGIFNKTNFLIKKQFTLVYNKAGDVRRVQVGLVNNANFVKGNQFGVLNIADDVKGVSMGLFNFIKNGYNVIEVGGGESLFANFGFKLGVRKFYNIIQFGYRFTDDTWSIGYGLGTGIRLNDKQHLHLEWILSHVNEGDWWTTEKNWLHQFRCTYDWQIGQKERSIFFGPTFNWLISNIMDAESGALVGSSLPTYSFLDTNRTSTNWKMWFGATVGLRF